MLCVYEEQFYCYEVSLVIKFSYTLYAYFVAACRPSYSETVFRSIFLPSYSRAVFRY